VKSEQAQKLRFVEEAVGPGVERGVWHAGPFTVVRYRYAPGAVFPPHQHEAAQLTVILAGRIRFSVDGHALELAFGETLYIPGGALHSAEVPKDSEPVVSLNVFHPPRKDHPGS